MGNPRRMMKKDLTRQWVYGKKKLKGSRFSDYNFVPAEGCPDLIQVLSVPEIFTGAALSDWGILSGFEMGCVNLSERVFAPFPGGN
jgi:hypothetical protein